MCGSGATDIFLVLLQLMDYLLEFIASVAVAVAVVDGQVDFLNSVIVDQQHKNEMLKARLQVMESNSFAMTDSISDASLVK